MGVDGLNQLVDSTALCRLDGVTGTTRSARHV
jgi:hypothetical protein